MSCQHPISVVHRINRRHDIVLHQATIETSNMVTNPVGPFPVRKCDTFTSTEIIQLYSILDIDVAKYFASVPLVNLFECQKTGLKFYWPQTCLGDADFYDLLQLRSGYYPTTKWEFQEALQLLRPEHRILEVGAGSGTFIANFNSYWAPACSPVGLELSPVAAESAKTKALDVRVESITSHSQNHRQFYDVVCAFQVLEHVEDVAAFIQSCLACTKPGGHLIFGVPLCYPYIYHQDRLHTLNLPPHHASLWNPEIAKRLAILYGVELVSAQAEPLGNLSYLASVCTRHYTKSRFFASIVGKAIDILPNRLKSLVSNLLPGHTFVFVLKKGD